ncbi:hypothetical protein LCGC14_2464160, partial [marine sediment metagenome]
SQRAVATKIIPRGQKILPGNVKIETVIAARPAKADWIPPYGMISRTRLTPGTVLRPGLLRQATSPILVRRNQTVIMKIERAGFTISGLAVALQDGRPGHLIQVRNIDTKRVIAAKVALDGSVEPVFEEKKR